MTSARLPILKNQTSNKNNIMKKTSVKTFQTTKVLGLILCLGALPLATMVTGCAGDRYHQSTGEAIDDHATSMRVKSALSNDAEYKYEGVDVKTFKGTVQLSGFVDTHAQKSRAADIAKGVEGVKDVENNITVKE
jgi:hyperosmotically inducible periplasmic protein